jgi:hypothetical protein
VGGMLISIECLLRKIKCIYETPLSIELAYRELDIILKRPEDEQLKSDMQFDLKQERSTTYCVAYTMLVKETIEY